MYKVTVSIRAGTIDWSASYHFADQNDTTKFLQMCDAHGFLAIAHPVSYVTWEPNAAFESLTKFAERVR